MKLTKKKLFLIVALGVVIFSVLGITGKSIVDNLANKVQNNLIAKNREYISTIKIPLEEKIEEAKNDEAYYEMTIGTAEEEAALDTVNQTLEELKKYVQDYNKLASELDSDTFNSHYPNYYDYDELYNEIKDF